MLSSSTYMTILYEVNHLFLGHYCCEEVQMNPRKTKGKIYRISKSCGIHIYWNIATDFAKNYDALFFSNTTMISSNIEG